MLLSFSFHSSYTFLEVLITQSLFIMKFGNHSLCICLSSGSPVLGYLAAGILIGPYGLSIIRHVHGTKAIAEFGVVFLLFNIGLEVQKQIFDF